MTRTLMETPLRRAILLAIAGGTAVMYGGPAAAQEKAATSSATAVTFEEVVVLGAPPELFRALDASSIARFDIPIEETPQSVSVITADLLQAANIQSLDDASYFVPGLVSLGLNGWGEPRSTFNARGNNVDLTTSFKLDNYSFAYQGLLDMVGIERIEFVRGPSGVSYGTASYGGIINLVTKKPMRQAFTTASVNYGSYDTFGFDGDINTPLTDDGRLRFRLGAGYRDGEGFRTGDEARILTVVPTMAYDVSDDTELSLIGYFQDAGNILGGSIPVLVDAAGNLQMPTDEIVPRKTFMGNEERNSSDNEIKSAVAKLRHSFNDTTKMDVVLTYTESRLDVVTSYSAPYSPTPLDPSSPGYGLVPSYTQVLYDEIKYLNAEVSLQKEFEAFGQEHTVFLLGGYQDFTREVGFAGACIPAINLFDFVSSDFLDVFVTEEEAETQSGNFCYGVGLYQNTNTSHIGAQAQINLTDRLSLLMGARYDSMERFHLQSDHGLSLDVILRDGSVLVDETEDQVSTRMGAVFEFTSSINGYLTYVTGFRPQIGVLRNGSVIETETGTLYEAGAKGVFRNGAFAVNAAVFQLEVDNSRVRDPNNQPGELFVLGAGESETWGYELEAVGKISESLTLSANYAYVDGETTSAPQNPALEGTPLPVGPYDKASLFLNYAFANGGLLNGLNMNTSVSFVGSQLPRSGYTLDYRIPSYTTVDLGAYYPLTDKLQIGLNIKNVLDEEYVLPGVDTYGVYYGEPRTFFVSFRTVL